MAYEVARVHGLIMSNIHEGEKDPAETWPLSKNMFQMPPPRQSPDTPLLYDFPSDANQWSESSRSPSSHGSSTETEETESDEEDDLIAGLAEQIAHSMLDDDEHSNGLANEAVDNTSPNPSSEAAFLYGSANEVSPKVVSPQSSWSPNSLSPTWCDSVSSSKQSSQVSSPPSTPFSSDDDAWALLNAAAGEVVRLKMNEVRKPIQKQVKAPTSSMPEMKVNARAPQPAWRTSPHPAQLSTPPNCTAGSRTGGPVQVSRDRFAAGNSHVQKSCRPREDERKVGNNVPAQQRLPRNEAVQWTQRRSSNAYKGGVNQKAGRQSYNYGHPRTTGKPVENMGVPQRSVVPIANGGSGMRAVFLGAAGSGRESGGTGVFLPRCVGSGSEQRRKPSCSTVLLPSRIVQVLNLNVEDMRTHPIPLPVAAPHGRNDYSAALRTPPHMYMMELSGSAMKYEGGNVPSFPRKMQCAQVSQSEPIEYSLPTEWTY